MSIVDQAAVVVAAASSLCALIALVAALDQCRRLRAPRAPCVVPVTLVMPVTGAALSLDDLHDRVCRQTCPPVRLIFVVESTADPAYGRAVGVADASPLDVRVLVAGPARRGTQKCHNTAFALRRRDLLEDYVVLADVDMAPEPTWLSDLLVRLRQGTADIVSGYRWLVPTMPDLATLSVAWLDRSIATLPKPDWLGLCWGGSIAARRDTLTRLAVADWLDGALTDDLALAEAARIQAMRVTFRAVVLVATPVAHDWPSLLAFGIRQYQLLRLYRPWLWRFAAAIVWVNLSASAALVALAPVSIIALAALPATWLLGIAIGLVRLDIGARCAPSMPTGRRIEALLCLMPLAGPFLHAVHGLILWRSRSCRRIVWSHCTYRLEGRRIVDIERSR